MLLSDALWPLAGGALIGLAATLLLAVNGRIAGISGITDGVRAGLLAPHAHRGELGWRAAFLAGLLAGGLLLALVAPTALPDTVDTPLTVLALAGLLVGFGTRLGSGCTSGHGVCGLSRRSPRSLAATLAFIGAGVAVVFVVRHVPG